MAAVHCELTARAARQDPPGRVPSLPTLHRAIQWDPTAGERAGLSAGERAARKHDVFLTRPRGHRNQAWETDHMQSPVLVLVDADAQLLNRMTEVEAASEDIWHAPVYSVAAVHGGVPAPNQAV